MEEGRCSTNGHFFSLYSTRLVVNLSTTLFVDKSLKRLYSTIFQSPNLLGSQKLKIFANSQQSFITVQQIVKHSCPPHSCSFVSQSNLARWLYTLYFLPCLVKFCNVLLSQCITYFSTISLL